MTDVTRSEAAPSRQDEHALTRPLGRFARHVPAVLSYMQLMSGAALRIGLQAIYFFALVNTLTLAQMGAFASITATGLMIGAFSGFGFSSFAFRAAAGHTRLLGRYLGAFYAALAVSLPLAILVASPVYVLLFDGTLAFWAFAAIISVETVIWRLVQTLQQVQGGLGNYARASAAGGVGMGARALGALLFAFTGGGSLEHWATIYICANLAGAATAMALFHPRVTLKLRFGDVKRRFRDGVLYCLSYFAFSVQNQVDKLIVLSLGDARTAGIYAIATRILDFSAMPFRVYYVMFTRKLIGEGRPRGLIRRALKAEGAIAAIATAGFLCLIAILELWPKALGPNVAHAIPLFAMMACVPAFKNLLEFHGEMFYVSQRMTARAVLAVTVVVLNTATLALLAASDTPLPIFGLCLNLLYAVLYGLSAVAVYRTMAQWSAGR